MMTMEKFYEEAKDDVKMMLECETDEKVEGEFEVVWSCHTLGNKKCLMINYDRPGEYYEVTYDNEERVIYCDIYKKRYHGAFQA